jgi:lactadherin
MLQPFRGNTDSHGVKVSYLEHPVRARFIRVHVDAWHNHPSLRMEIIGCQATYRHITVPEFLYAFYLGI